LFNFVFAAHVTGIFFKTGWDEPWSIYFFIPRLKPEVIHVKSFQDYLFSFEADATVIPCRMGVNEPYVIVLFPNILISFILRFSYALLAIYFKISGFQPFFYIIFTGLHPVLLHSVLSGPFLS